MKQFTFIIKDALGIHARPAGMLANCAKGFTSDVRISTQEKTADGKRLLSLMSLGATQGTRLTCTVEGADEEAAAHALEDCLKEMLGHE